VIPLAHCSRVASLAAFRFSAQTRLRIEDDSLRAFATVVQDELFTLTGFETPIVAGGARGNDILLRIDRQRAAGASQVQVTPQSITVLGSDQTTLAQGRATLLQLLCLALADSPSSVFEIQCGDSEATADVPYRGVLVDCARHYQSPGVLRQVIALASLYKLSHVHLHLSDDPAFTFPCRFAPQLTESSPWSYGRSELRELVEFARLRGIVLLPEIDLPGHASAFLRALPKLRGGSGLIAAAREETYEFLEELWSEVAEVFSTSPRLHLGGDEVRVDGWQLQGEERAFLRRHHLQGPTKLYHYFLARSQEIVHALGREAAFWEGFTGCGAFGNDGRIAAGTPVYAWDSTRNPAEQLAANGFRVINASFAPLYVIGGGQPRRPHVAQSRWPPADVYAWSRSHWGHRDPDHPLARRGGSAVPEQVLSAIEGGQLCVWEQGERSLLDDLHPRLAAFSERLFHASAGRSAEDFDARWRQLRPGIERLLAPVQVSPCDPQPAADAAYDARRFAGICKVVLQSTSPRPGEIHYSLDGSVPSIDSLPYLEPIALDRPQEIRAALFSSTGQQLGGATWVAFCNAPMHVHCRYLELPEERLLAFPDCSTLRVLRQENQPGIRGPYRDHEPQLRELTATLRVQQSGQFRFDALAPKGLLQVHVAGDLLLERSATTAKQQRHLGPAHCLLQPGDHSLRIIHYSLPGAPLLVVRCQPPTSPRPIDLAHNPEQLLVPLPLVPP
jgi:hexosaminidase